jgi:hypothetical protein
MNQVPSLFTQVVKAAPHEQQLQIYLDFIKILKESDPSQPDDFVVNYRKTVGSLDRNDPGTPIQEQLGKELSILKCLEYLIKVYPNRNVTIEDAKKCQTIFKILVRNATHVEWMDDQQGQDGYSRFDVCWDGFHQPGIFAKHRSTIVKELFNTTRRLHIVCYNIDLQEEDVFEPNFWLDQLIDSEGAYQVFLDFWTKLPTNMFAPN